MTTSTLDVGNLFSVLGAHGIEKQLKRVAGVGRVTVNAVSGATTVAYNPKKTSLAKIRSKIDECGFHCSGEALPKHICTDHPAVAKTDQKGADEHKKSLQVRKRIRAMPEWT